MKNIKKILFSAFDAGGGNAVLPVAKNISKSKQFKTLCIVGGPSKDIFKRGKIKFISADLLTKKELKKLVETFRPNFFISGTSAGLTFDKKILPTVQKMGTKSIYILDY